MIDASRALAGTHSASLDPFLLQLWREQLIKLSVELRIIRKGFDVTDYLADVQYTYLFLMINYF